MPAPSDDMLINSLSSAQLKSDKRGIIYPEQVRIVRGSLAPRSCNSPIAYDDSVPSIIESLFESRICEGGSLHQEYIFIMRKPSEEFDIFFCQSGIVV